MLKDPETLPAIIAELLDGPLARVRAAALGAAGLLADATLDQVESAFHGPHAWIRRITPPLEFAPPRPTATSPLPLHRPSRPDDSVSLARQAATRLLERAFAVPYALVA